MSAYEKLKTKFRRSSLLGDVGELLQWDQAVVMPEASAKARAEQAAELSLVTHEIISDPALPDLIEQAAAELGSDANPWDLANLDLMRRDYTHASAVPPDLVAAEIRAATSCEMHWRQARADNDFKGLANELDTLLQLVREIGVAKSAALGIEPYDALMDQYEPGARIEKITPIFDKLAEFLPGFLAEVLEFQAGKDAPLRPKGPFPEAAQRRLGEQLMVKLGFDFSRGRLDESHHPFCGGATGDVRITTRYDEADFMSAFLATIHETGHALYEINRPENWSYQPVGLAGGMALHESQSLALEMQMARGLPFLTHVAPIIRDAFDATPGPEWEPENLSRLFTHVEPGYIRVEADEVTYPVHVILRTRLERAMIAGDLAVGDLPGAWNDGMQDLLGLTPPDDTHGCLQDVHWPSGAFGYFPTYTMGAIAAAQFVAGARKSDVNLDAHIADGDFAKLTSWMTEHVHSQGRVADTDEVLSRAVGRTLDVDAYIGHLKARYLN